MKIALTEWSIKSNVAAGVGAEGPPGGRAALDGERRDVNDSLLFTADGSGSGATLLANTGGHV